MPRSRLYLTLPIALALSACHLLYPFSPDDQPRDATADGATDTIQSDHLLVPDGGCPPTTTQCGKICVDLAQTRAHCGGCGKACDSRSDRCVDRSCQCGLTGGPCASGQDCVKGQCRCIAGGRCGGCCEGDNCVGLGASQSKTRCGMGGAACAPCDDKNACSSNSCSSAGACVFVQLSTGVPCDDGVPCTHSDLCQAGKCSGTAYTCDDSVSCTINICVGVNSKKCLLTVAAGMCHIEGYCRSDNVGRASDACKVCAPALDQKDWSLAKGCVSTLAGSGSGLFADGPALTATFKAPHGLSLTSAGALIVADQSNHRIRKIEGGMVSTIAGVTLTGTQNGPVATARFYFPQDVAVAASGTVYVSDTFNNRIRTITGGTVSTLAGSNPSFWDGPTSGALFKHPIGLALDATGANLYLSDQYNQRIRGIDLNKGKVFTVAGGSVGAQDGVAATFNFPQGIVYGAYLGMSGLAVADATNNLIRGVTLSTGMTSTVAGGTTAGTAIGAAAKARFSFPTDVAILPVSGGTPELIVADRLNNRIQRIYEQGGAIYVSTLAGGTKGYQDGPAAKATFSLPSGLAVSATGLIYVSDSGNNRIRVIRP
jgi:sugar lactone lactonase YvrE